MSSRENKSMEIPKLHNIKNPNQKICKKIKVPRNLINLG
jgi:hypothetical protein